MVIQPNMRIMDVAKIWPETIEVFTEYEISIYTHDMIEDCIQGHLNLLDELNKTVGSSTDTCIEGG
jgi:hypothetical protein